MNGGGDILPTESPTTRHPQPLFPATPICNIRTPDFRERNRRCRCGSSDVRRISGSRQQRWRVFE
ncbi:hypothetical protein HanPI659440_Chr11g0417241 [Helianthus annuus]|nr:hypothetical protein HanPI659440_Chr11g0417241 [Helianthus annuus]